MNPLIPSEEGMGEKRRKKAYRLALRAEVEVSNREELLWELIEYRYNLQKLVDELWSLREVLERASYTLCSTTDSRKREVTEHM